MQVGLVVDGQHSFKHIWRTGNIGKWVNRTEKVTTMKEMESKEAEVWKKRNMKKKLDK